MRLLRPLLFASTLLVSVPAAAQDLGHRLVGTQGLYAGRQREPGLYVADQLDYYGAEPLRDRNVDEVPVEDLRIDFEDGYGHRPDAEEDGHAVSAAEELARGLAQELLPPFIGIRVKSFTEELFDRAGLVAHCGHRERQIEADLVIGGIVGELRL